MKDEKFFCDLTALFWRYYILEPTKEHFEKMFSYFSEQLVLIGTGKHEFFTDARQILENMSGNQVEAESVRFQVLDEWYECLMISQDVFLVYGGIWVRQQGNPEDEVLIEMDTRFSFLYRMKGDKCELIHIHHSIPYIDQQQGEYYPKTLSEQAKAAMNLAEVFKSRSELDLMTEVYNNTSFEHYVTKYLGSCINANLYLFDLDCFKMINDTYGHMAGDAQLKLFSKLLKNTFSSDAVLGRVGGDEFAVFEYAPMDKEGAIQKIEQLQEAFDSTAQKNFGRGAASFSVGIVSVAGEGLQYDTLFARADKSLYHAKQLGRKTYCWYAE